MDRIIGSGAFASIWLAHDDTYGATVAIKVLASSVVDDLDVRDRFLEEARILHQADSPRLIPVHEVGELPDGRPYFVMSYADRGTLAERMRARTLSVAEARALAVQVAHGVAAVNDMGIIHRDLKPSNVLFQSTPDGGERLLIADLGLAKAVAHASGAFTLPVGTPGYMSPEQAKFGGGLDVRADVYGLGALTYHLLARKAPGGAPVRRPPSELRPEVSRALDSVVMRAMEPDREHRWPTAEAFAAALAAAPTEPPPSAEATRSIRPPPPRPTPDRRPPAPPRREPSASAEPTRVDLPTGRPSVPSASAPPPKRKRTGTILLVVGLIVVAAIGAGVVYHYVAGGSDGAEGTRHEKRTDGLVTVTDASATFSLRVPKAWQKQPLTDWPDIVPITDGARAPALRATPDYQKFVSDTVAVPGVFVGLTHDVRARLPPVQLGSHERHCAEGASRPYRHGGLNGKITPWDCPGQITIDEVGLHDARGRFAMWIRVKLTGGHDITTKILDSIRVHD